MLVENETEDLTEEQDEEFARLRQGRRVDIGIGDMGRQSK